MGSDGGGGGEALTSDAQRYDGQQHPAHQRHQRQHSRAAPALVCAQRAARQRVHVHTQCTLARNSLSQRFTATTVATENEAAASDMRPFDDHPGVSSPGALRFAGLTHVRMRGPRWSLAQFHTGEIY